MGDQSVQTVEAIAQALWCRDAERVPKFGKGETEP
jgi:hypothetical protein